MKLTISAIACLTFFTLIPANAEMTRHISVAKSSVTAVYMIDNIEVAQEVFSNSGKLLSSEGDIPDGQVVQFNSKGVLIGEWSYLNGRKDGLTKRYYDNGKPKIEVTYSRGMRHGVYKLYSTQGTLIRDDNYSYGALHGLCKVYLSNGRLFSEINYSRGKKDGKTIIYYENGRIGEESNYKSGKRDGTCQTYFDTPISQVENIFTYKDGHLLSHRCFDIEGKVILEKDFSTPEKDKQEVEPQ